ncbi:unnamed protein product, partial [Mesorhabditis spiculigera]
MLVSCLLPMFLTATQAFPWDGQPTESSSELEAANGDEFVILRSRKNSNGAAPDRMERCEYLHLLGIYTPECEAKGYSPPTEAPTTTTVPPPPPTCQRKFYQDRCRPHPQCVQGGMMCRDVSNNLCCKPGPDQCPTQEQLGIVCSKTARLVSWCSNDTHCTKGTKCCPSGCGYNICI